MLWTSLRCQSVRSLNLCRPHVLPRFLPRRHQSTQQIPPPNIRSFSDTIPPPSDKESFSERVEKPRAGIHILYGLSTSLLVFTFAAIATNNETDFWVERLRASSPIWNFQTATSVDLRRMQTAELVRGIREKFARFNAQVEGLPLLIKPWVQLAFVSVAQPWIDTSEGKRLCWKICMLNAGVWLAWKVRRWQGPMSRWFMHHPLSGLAPSLLFSMFSHRSFVHLLFNCLALESFGSAAYFYLTREQEKSGMLESTSTYHFMAFFISAGLFSGLVSHVAETKFRYPRLLAKLTLPSFAAKTDTWAAAVAASTRAASSSPSVLSSLSSWAKTAAPASAAIVNTEKAAAVAAAGSILPTLGASGAIYASVTLTALAFPNSQVALVIPPSYPISIQTGVGAMVALDMIGVLRGWRVFNHYAHLGGAAFGVGYYMYGPQTWDWFRRETRKLQIESRAASGAAILDQNARIVVGAIQLPPNSEPVTDADEEVFLLYSTSSSHGDSSTSFRGLGHVDSRKDTLNVTFDLKGPSNSSDVVKSKGKAPKKTKQRSHDKTVEIQLFQDKTALRTRKGDTGSVLWNASIDFAQLILQQLHSENANGLFNANLLKTQHVLELGSGTGFLSIALAPYVRHYTATDIPELIPLIRKNVNLNTDGVVPGLSSGSSASLSSNISTLPLDWILLHNLSEPQRSRSFPLQSFSSPWHISPLPGSRHSTTLQHSLSNITSEESAHAIDLILVVDCIYHPSLLPPLITTLNHLAAPGYTAVRKREQACEVDKSTLTVTPVLIAVELRAADVIREFLFLWLDAGWTVWRVGEWVDDFGVSTMGKVYVMWVGWKNTTDS